jgi:hypothetical protein
MMDAKELFAHADRRLADRARANAAKEAAK